MGNKNIKSENKLNTSKIITDKIYNLAKKIYIEDNFSKKYMTIEQIKCYIERFFISNYTIQHINNQQIKYNKIDNNINYQQGIIYYTESLKKELKSLKLNGIESIVKNNHKSIDEIDYYYDENYSSTLMSPKYDEILYLVDDSPDIYLSIIKFIKFILTINNKLENIKYKI